jgi:hypothetical protein
LDEHVAAKNSDAADQQKMARCLIERNLIDGEEKCRRADI